MHGYLMEGLLARDIGPICKISKGDLWAACHL